MSNKIERNRLIYGWFRFGGMRNIDLVRHFGLSKTRISQIVYRFQRWERGHALWLERGGPGRR